MEKKRRYSRRRKAAAVIMLFVCLAMTAGGFLGIFYLNRRNPYFSKSELVRGVDFKESTVFYSMLKDDIYHILELVPLKQLVEKEGVLDVEQPAVAYGYDSGYVRIMTLGELMAEISSQGNKFNYDYYFGQKDSDAFTDAASKESFMFSGSGQILIYWDLFSSMSQEKTVSAEEVQAFLWELLDTNAEIETQDFLNQWRKKLGKETMGVANMTTLDYYVAQIYDKMASYQKYNTLYENGNLAYRFRLRNSQTDEAQIIQNEVSKRWDRERADGEWEDSSGWPWTEEKSKGTYISYSSRDVLVEKNLDREIVSANDISRVIQEINGNKYSEYSFDIGIDCSFSQNDKYTQLAVDYGRMQILLFVSLGCIVLGCIATLWFTFYLIMASGHEVGSEEIHLTWFEKIPTEPAVLLILSAMAVVSLLTLYGIKLCEDYLLSSFIMDYVTNILVIGAAGVIGLLGLFSMIRRLKARTVWSNSIIGILLLKIYNFIHKEKTERAAIMRILGGLVVLHVLNVAALAFIQYIMNKNMGKVILYCLIIFYVLTASGLILKTGMEIYREVSQKKRIAEGVHQIAEGNLEYEIDCANMTTGNYQLADGINHIGAGMQNALERAVKSERMKTELITNVSHDIKTPLTSIINYVELLKREDIEGEKAKDYIQVLERKSQRLKNLTEDLVEFSKASSGNLVLSMERIDFVELINQAAGEFDGKFASRHLTQVIELLPEPVHIMADGRTTWRIIENLFQNAAKYAMEGTRVYVEVKLAGADEVVFVLKNISSKPLNISADELTERFVRGDVSRTTEGSGLGLSIAKTLTEIQKGKFELYLDGDLFRATVKFKVVGEQQINSTD